MSENQLLVDIRQPGCLDENFSVSLKSNPFTETLLTDKLFGHICTTFLHDERHHYRARVHCLDSFQRRDIKPLWAYLFYSCQSHARKKTRRTPFSFTFEEFIALPYKKIKRLYSQVMGSHKDSLEKAWKSGIRHVVICNNEIVLKSDNVAHISNEKIKELSEERNTACYVFSAPDFVEESIWHECSAPEPPYPTLPVYIGQIGAEEDEIINDSPPIITDYDTGNPDLKCFKSAIINPIVLEGAKIFRHGEHLQREYVFYLRLIKLCIKDINNNVNSKNYDVLFLDEWEEDCAFRQASPNRLGLIGRDVLYELGVKLLLDSRIGETQILQVG